MASNTVKCNTCNVVISEILAFVQNKIDVMDEESLVRICTTSFTTDEVSSAKKLLFESAPSSKRKVNRRGNGKSERDLFDIITLLKETDPELIPIFVAKQLHKLPPVTFDHLDATRLLKDIIVLQRELQLIKETYATKEDIVTMKNDLDHCKNTVSNKGSYPKTSSVNNICIVGGKTPDLPQCAADATAAVVIAPSRSCVPNAGIDISLEHFVDACASTMIVEDRTAAPNANLKPTDLRERVNIYDACNEEKRQNIQAMPHNTATQKFKTFADIVQVNVKKDEGNDWNLVQRKKRFKGKFTGIRGQANINSMDKFKAADSKCYLFVNNVDKNVSEEDILTYLMSKTQIEVTVEKINMKIERNYNAYKILVPKSKLTVFLDENLWPEGVKFRKYVDLRKTFNRDIYKNNNNGSQNL